MLPLELDFLFVWICRRRMLINISLSITLTWRYSATKTQDSFQDFSTVSTLKRSPQKLQEAHEPIG